MDNRSVLIAEDELTLQMILVAYFKKEGFIVYTADNGIQALQHFRNYHLDCVCLDVMMPHLDGWNVLRTIRKTSDIPVIMMTALSSDEDALKGYELKVDDYVTKPFSPLVLIAKVKNIINRYYGNLSVDRQLIKSGLVIVDKAQRIVTIDNNSIELSKTEFDLLSYFIDNENIALSRDKILDNVWGYETYVDNRVVDTFVKSLRKKLGNCSSYIKTVFGVGYKYKVSDDDK